MTVFLCWTFRKFTFKYLSQFFANISFKFKTSFEGRKKKFKTYRVCPLDLNTFDIFVNFEMTLNLG